MNKSLIWGVAILLAILLIGGGIYYSNSSNGNVSGKVIASDVDTKVISLSANNFTYAPEIIKVKKGEHIKIVIDNIDTQHGIAIPELGIKGIDSVEFTADKVGTYDFHCPTFCGPGHREMAGTLIVEE